MRRWLAGDLMCVAAGIALVVAAFMPVTNVEGDRFYALQLRMYAPVATACLTGAALIAAGTARNLWAGAVGLVAAFVVGIAVIMVHEGVFAGLVGLGVPAAAAAVEVPGMGEYMLFAAGALGAAGGIVVVVQREPPVRTRPEHALPDEGFTLP